MATILGPLPQLQRIDYTLSRTEAGGYEATWIGTLADINAILAAESGNAEGFRISQRGPVYELVGSYLNAADGSTAGTPVTTLELDTGIRAESIFRNKTFQALDEAEQSKIVEVFGARMDTRGEALTEINTVVIDAGKRILAAKAYDFLKVMGESWDRHEFAITRTQHADRRYSIALDLTTIDLLWTGAQLAAYVGSPHLFGIASLALTTEESNKNLFSGWRQNLCRVTDSSDGSRVMTEQWILGKWSLDLYDAKP